MPQLAEPAATARRATPAGGRPAAWRAYGDANLSEEEALKTHLPLVRSVVDRMRASLPAHLEIQDLYSVGLLGLIQARRKFDPTLGVTFSTYATMRIRGSVLDELRRMDWMSRSLRTKAREVTDTIAAIEQQTGRPATEEEVASRLGMPTSEYTDLLDELRPLSYLELDASTGDDEASSLHEVVADTSQPTASELAAKQELIRLVVERIQQLPDMQRKILAMYYFENLRLAEIAQVFNLTESRICQIHTQAVLGLKNYIRSMLNR
jgi:RNA polymerase sigma factor FliA